MLLCRFRILRVISMLVLVLNVAVPVSNFCVLFWWILQYCRYEIVVMSVSNFTCYFGACLSIEVLNAVVSVTNFTC
jgi:hypothetical protein